MLSLDCQGCSQRHQCAIRFQLVRVGECVYCENGERHLVDQ
jgi:hypothetical protein